MGFSSYAYTAVIVFFLSAFVFADIRLSLGGSMGLWSAIGAVGLPFILHAVFYIIVLTIIGCVPAIVARLFRKR